MRASRAADRWLGERAGGSRGAGTPLISVVIPTYNRADLLRETVESVLAQTYAPVEVIVVDDGSTDGTAALMQGYTDRVVYIRQENRGGTAARNTGTRAAKGTYLNWLDHDDLMLPTKLERQVEVLETRPEVGLVHCGYYRIDKDGNVLDRITGLPEGDVRRRLVCGCFIWSGAPLVRRECIERMGLFDESVWSSDADMWLRIALAGYRFGCVQDPLGKYRILPDSTMADVARTERLDFATLDRIFADPALPRDVAAMRTDAYFNQRFWLATRYYTIGEWADAERNLTAALALRPELLANPEELLQWVTGSAFDPRVSDALRYLDDVLEHLPPAGGVLRAHRTQLLSQVGVRLALRHYALGRLAEAKSALARAVREDPTIFDRPQEFAGALHETARRMEVEPRAYFDTVLLNLPHEARWLVELRAHLLSEMFLAAAFREYWAGHFRPAVRQAVQALRHRPALLPWLLKHTLRRGFSKARRSLVAMAARDPAVRWNGRVGDAPGRATREPLRADETRTSRGA